MTCTYIYVCGCWINYLFMTSITRKHFGGSNRTDIVFFIYLVNTSFFSLSQISTELLWDLTSQE